jgi:murein DD-endopeptidase MepM/ murein hydrolase activator NlpD
MFHKPRQEQQKPCRTVLSSMGTSAGDRLRWSAWMLSAGAVVTSVAIASILPQPSKLNLAAPLAEFDLIAFDEPERKTVLIPETTDAGKKLIHTGERLLRGLRPAAYTRNGAEYARSAVPVQALSYVPELSLALRTGPLAMFGDFSSHPPQDTRHRLISLSPPYTSSGSGNFEVRMSHISGTIERSLYEAGREAGLPDALTTKLAQIFGWDIDFALDVEVGDSFRVVYEEKYWLGRKVAQGPILAAEFWNRGRLYRAIGFRAEDGTINYYTPSGRNLKRTFLRTPVKLSNVSSSFSSWRYHPILKLWRAHNGVDYAAPEGTPVHATASGRVVSAGWSGGYGNMVVIDHGATYSTLYAHLSHHRSGLQAGQKIDQGEVIGYVGKTGLATGPHLHYEFQVNGEHKNPLTFQFPDGAPIAETARAEFKRIAQEWVAELDLLGGRHLAIR